jgi:hypothetical protein
MKLQGSTEHKQSKYEWNACLIVAGHGRHPSTIHVAEKEAAYFTLWIVIKCVEMYLNSARYLRLVGKLYKTETGA